MIPTKHIDNIGKIFGRLTVVDVHKEGKYLYYAASCACGK